MRTQFLLISLGIIAAYAQTDATTTDATATEITPTDTTTTTDSSTSSTTTTTTTEKVERLVDCYKYGDYYFYDLTALRNETKDYKIISTNSLRTYVFNFCQEVNAPCEITTNGTAYAYSFLGTSMTQYPGTCAILGNADESSIISTKKDVNDTHLVMTHPGGQWCGDYHNESSSITFEIQCNQSITAQPVQKSFSFNDSHSDYCNPVVMFTHASGCPDATLDTVAIFLEEYPWVLAIFLLVVGPVICFFGKRFIPWVIAVIGGVVAFIIVLALCSAMGMLDYIDPTNRESSSVFWVVLAFFLSLGGGVLTGYLLKRFLIVGLLVIAFVGGFLVGGLLYNLVFAGWANSTWLLAILTFGSGIGACVAAYFLKLVIIIGCTALIGSYFTIRGLSLFIGGFPSEITLYQQISNNTATYSTTFIGYLVGMAVLFGLGFFYQWRNKTKGAEHDSHFSRV